MHIGIFRLWKISECTYGACTYRAILWRRNLQTSGILALEILSPFPDPVLFPDSGFPWLWPTYRSYVSTNRFPNFRKQLGPIFSKFEEILLTSAESHTDESAALVMFCVLAVSHGSTYEDPKFIRIPFSIKYPSVPFFI